MNNESGDPRKWRKGVAQVTPERNRKNWTHTDETKLRRMYNSGRLTITQIAGRLGRTRFATIKKASRMTLTYGKCYIRW